MTAPVDTAAGTGDARAFGRLVQLHRSELYVHCVRILRSPEQAEDALQEALLRAWRSRSGYAGRASVRAWLYRIATNACLDEIRRDHRRARRAQAPRVVALDDGAPLPADATAAAGPGPDVVVEARETVTRAFLAVIELLPPRQRAVLILCEVLRCPAAETAELLGTTVAAVSSALQRARATLAAERPGPAGGRLRDVGPTQRLLLDRYVAAVCRHDVAAVVEMARAEAAGEPALRYSA